MRLDAVPRRRLDARARLVRGVLYVAGPEQAFELSEAAAYVWRWTDGRRTIQEIGAALAAEYDIDPDVATNDVTELLTELEAHNVIEVIDAPRQE